ncbi:MAG TPA: lipoprotein-releasing system ATP-binding protein LolD [Cytophagales bacterium]|nr:lipoprotein-releasing system ATP-binding protein LolD [Cytophagales bacterium]
MIEAIDLKKNYNELQVLKGVSLHIGKGEFVSIVGPSGAGKSTLLHIIGTLDKYDHGNVLIEGQNPFTMKSSKLASFRNSEFGFVFQFHNLLPEFTALENVCLPGLIGKRAQKEVEKEARDWLERLGLKKRMDHKPSELSGGEQQRVSVARALINKPKIIFADEPTGNLDADNADQMHKLFLELNRDLGITFVVVTHNQDFANMAHRKVEMRDGQIV